MHAHIIMKKTIKWIGIKLFAQIYISRCVFSQDITFSIVKQNRFSHWLLFEVYIQIRVHPLKSSQFKTISKRNSEMDFENCNNRHLLLFQNPKLKFISRCSICAQFDCFTLIVILGNAQNVIICSGVIMHIFNELWCSFSKASKALVCLSYRLHNALLMRVTNEQYNITI